MTTKTDLRTWDDVVRAVREFLVVDVEHTIVVGADGLEPFRYLSVRHECDDHDLVEVRVIFDDDERAPWLWATNATPVPTRWVSDKPAPLARYQVMIASDGADWLTLDALPEAIADWLVWALGGEHATFECDACGKRAVDEHRAGGRHSYHDEGTFCDECAGVL